MLRSTQFQLTGLIIFTAATLLMASLAARSDSSPKGTEPEISQLFPLGGPPGGTFQIEICGHNLEGAHALWSDNPAFQTWIDSVEPVREPTTAGGNQQQQPQYRIAARLAIDPSLDPGRYPLRIVAEAGVSNALSFWVHPEPPTAETDRPHSLPTTAQRLSLPAALDGVIREAGEVDCYEFEASQDQKLVFELTPTSARATLYATAGSWFEPDRVLRLDFEERLLPRYRQLSEPQYTYRFTQAGRYLLRITATSADSSYRLRIADVKRATSRPKPKRWQERSFNRKLNAGWLQRLWVRGFKPNLPTSAVYSRATHRSESLPRTSSYNDTAAPALQREMEPNDDPGLAPVTTLPVILEGTIEKPGDLDHIRFTAKRNQTLIFEIETDLSPPNGTTFRANFG